MDIKVIDDFLPEYIQDKLLDFCMSGEMGFKYLPLTLPTYGTSNNYNDGEQFISVIARDGEILNDDFSHYYLLPLQIASLMVGFEFDLKYIFRAKINFKLKQHTNLKEIINPPHRDHNFLDKKAYTLIYYINDSDGDTIIYEGDNIDGLKEMKRISPKKGRVAVIDSKLFHSASHPVHSDRRLIINYNLIF